MTGLSLNSYLASKVIILGGMAFVQSLLVTAVFVLRLGSPEYGAFLPSIVEIFITFYLSTLSATALGLFVSSLFDNPDKATVVAPILLMPQMLFSGIVFKLEGALKYVSYLINCRWGMQGFGCTADVTSRVETAVDVELQNTIAEIESVVSQSGHNLCDGVKNIINDSLLDSSWNYISRPKKKS
jgi:ABC-type transport system involved in multi-copper enzyme maturation permease subunit